MLGLKIGAMYSNSYTSCENDIRTRTPTVRLCLLLLLAALAAAGLAGCGSTVSTGSFKGEGKVVAERISTFQSDLVASNRQKLCANDLARAVQTRLHAAGSTCQQALKNQLGAIDDFEMSVQKIVVLHTAATAQVKSTWAGKLRLSTLALVKEGGAWKIASVQ
jgi:hypothetical protein